MIRQALHHHSCQYGSSVLCTRSLFQTTPFTPLLYSKTGIYAEVYLFFLFLLQKHRLWVLVRTHITHNPLKILNFYNLRKICILYEWACFRNVLQRLTCSIQGTHRPVQTLVQKVIDQRASFMIGSYQCSCFDRGGYVKDCKFAFKPNNVKMSPWHRCCASEEITEILSPYYRRC